MAIELTLLKAQRARRLSTQQALGAICQKRKTDGLVAQFALGRKKIPKATLLNRQFNFQNQFSAFKY
ncbi:MAG: hypothetical protein K6A35_06615 [bacterium]|nr:hypothetical protein [bacterium]